MKVFLQIQLHNWKQLLITLDQAITTLISMIIVPHKKVYGDLTFSAQCWLWSMRDGIDWPRKIVDTILFFDKNHCEESYESELKGLQLPPELRSYREEHYE